MIRKYSCISADLGVNRYSLKGSQLNANSKFRIEAYLSDYSTDLINPLLRWIGTQ